MGVLLFLASLLAWGTLLYVMVRRRVPFDDPSAPRVRATRRSGALLLIVVAFLFTSLTAVATVWFGPGWLPFVVLGATVVWTGWKASSKQPAVEQKPKHFFGPRTRNSMLFVTLPGILVTAAVAALIVEKGTWSATPLLVFPGFLLAWVWWLAFQAKRDETTEHSGSPVA